MKKNERKQTALTQLISQTEALLSALRDMQAGMSVTKACEKNNIQDSYVRHLLYKPLDELKSSTELTPAVFLEPAEELYCDVLELSKDKLRAIPEDIDETMESAMEKAKLDTNRKAVLRMTYWEDMTQAQIAEKLGVTGARVNQLYADAMRKLRKPPIAQLIRYGQAYETACQKIRAAWHEANDNRISANLNTMRLASVNVEKSTAIEDLKNLYFQVKSAIEAAQDMPEQLTPVSSLGFDKTMTQALEENNIYTFRDLHFITKHTVEKLQHEHGVKLVLYMAEHGIHLLSEKEAEFVKTDMPDVYAPIKVQDIPLTNRTIRALTRNGVMYLHQLRKIPEQELMKMRGMGKAGIADIKTQLAKYETF